MDTLVRPTLHELHDQLAATRVEMKRIRHEGWELRSRIIQLIDAYAEKYKCDASSADDLVAAHLESLIEDAVGPAWRKHSSICSKIEALEDAA